MSQIYKSAASTPSVPTSFVTDNGTVVPAANIVNINGASSTVDNANGIIAQANPNGSNNLQIALSNRLMGTGTSTNGSTVDLITFPLAATAQVYRFEFLVSGRDTATNNGVGYTMYASAKTSGAAATVVATPFLDNDEDAALITASLNFIASGNSVILQAVGVTGFTINYKAVGSYVVV